MTTTQDFFFVKYELEDRTVFEGRKAEYGREWTVLQVSIPASGPGEVRTLKTVTLHEETVESTEEEYMDAYFKVIHAAMEGEFVDDEDFDFATMEVPDETGTCGKCGKVASVVQTHIDGDSVEGLLCYDCCGDGGYCFGCGVFAEGLSEYDFSRIGHYCEYCQDQIRTEYGEDY